MHPYDSAEGVYKESLTVQRWLDEREWVPLAESIGGGDYGTDRAYEGCFVLLTAWA